MLKQDYINKYYQQCKDACAGSPIFPIMAFAESALESGWGSSYLTLQANNFFGIKSTEGWEAIGGKFVTKPTREVVNGQSIIIQAKFRAYPTAKDCFTDYISFIDGPRYQAAGVESAQTPEDMATALQAAGYATDPNYAAEIIAVMQSLRNVPGFQE